LIRLILTIWKKKFHTDAYIHAKVGQLINMS